MRKILVLFSISLVTNMFAQNINQFDENGKRHGRWEKKYEGTDKLRYQGQFNHGKEQGVFKFYHKEAKGVHPSCIKQFDVASDTVIVKYYSSKGIFLSEGKMKGKFRIGKWKSYERNTGALVDVENYVHGKLEGVKTSYYNDGKVLQTQEFKNDLLHGKKIMYAPNGKVSSEYAFVKGKSHGYFVEYDEEGNKKMTGKYEMNKPRGLWKYYTNGKLTKSVDYTLSNNPKKRKKKK
ncbi:MAG: toxin-antitoxin system YwqK family antitoxin [Flavobacteriaceae bacterium]